MTFARGLDSLSSLQLHDLHDNTQMSKPALEGSRSPELHGLESPSDPDPGLSSPYMGPQRHLSSVDHEFAFSAHALTSHTSTPSSPVQQQQSLDSDPGDPNYSPMVVVFVISSLAALVLLGLTVAIVYASQLLRRAVFQRDVWKLIVGAPQGEKAADDETCESKNVIGGEGKRDEEMERSKERSVVEIGPGDIAAREMPSEWLLPITTDAVKPAERLVEDPDVPSLPDRPSASFAATVNNCDRDRDRNLGLALVAWTYNNWVTHFMMALFGWLSVFVGATGSR